MSSDLKSNNYQFKFKVDKSRSQKTYEFEEFRLDAAHRLLYKNGSEISLTPKVVETLLALVEHCGEVLSKDELMDIIWADSFVEEGNLTQNLYILRKVLQKKTDGTPFIETLKRRGYRFTGDVSRVEAQTPEQSPANKIQFPTIENDENRTAENLSQIVGREKEISQIKNLLRQNDVRLVTLAGVGGTGKTKLAQAVMHQLAEDFSDGVFFIELAAVTKYELVVSVITQSLEIKETGNQPSVENLKNYLQDKQLLLVIDNFEQVIDAAPEMTNLLDASDNLKILITSRMLLNQSAECEFRVPPLSLPDENLTHSIKELSGYEAVKLFVERARSGKPNFVLTKDTAADVGEICRRLDGLPLAIELAAARVKILSPSAILARLKNQLSLLTGGAQDLPARQQTMRETVRWSYDLLDEDEKMLFQRLSVFAGSFDIEVAEAIGSKEKTKNSKKQLSDASRRRPPTTFLDVLTSLVDKNLVITKEQADGRVRFRMLEVVCEFAVEILEADGELETVRRNHAEYYLHLAETAEPFLQTADSAQWLGRLEREHDNLRAALHWAMQSDVNLGQNLIGAVWRSWWLHGHIREACEWLGAFLNVNASDEKAGTKMFLGAGFLNRLSGNFGLSRSFTEQGLTLARKTGDAKNTAFALYMSGMLALDEDALIRAEDLFKEGLVFAKDSGDKQILGLLLNGLGEFARIRQDHEQATNFYLQALKINREIGDAVRQTTNLINLGATYLGQKDFENAGYFYNEGLKISSQSADMNGTIYCLEGRAGAYWATQNPERAALLFGAASALRQSNNLFIEPPDLPLYNQSVARVRDSLTEKVFDEFYREGQKLKLEETVALCLEESADENGRADFKQIRTTSAIKIPFPIVGREKEISQIKNLLLKDDVRLLTLAGIGGTGKTRLAEAVAQEVERNFSDGVFFVELAAITNPESVAQTIARTLGIKDAGDEAVLENLKNFLRDKQLLLVIDNFEQVIDAAPNIAELVADNLKILVTSRTLLNLSAEREFIVPPLDLPDGNLNISPDELSKYEAVELFVQRARRIQPDFALTTENADAVAEICRRLDGLPLAIELAAARIKVFSLPAILERLESQLNLLTGGAKDLPERRQTMRGMVRWSYDLLDENEKILFQKLSVFAGSFTVKAAEAVGKRKEEKRRRGKEEEENFSSNIAAFCTDIFDVISSLLDKSLIIRTDQKDGESRFRMLEVVREYALELFEKNDEAEVVRRTHADYFLQLGEAAEPHLLGADSIKWLDRLETEHDNLREALGWLLENDVITAARLAGAIYFFWNIHSHQTEARQWMEAILRQSEQIAAEMRLKLVNQLGSLARAQGDHEAAIKFFGQGLEMGRAMNNLPQMARSTRNLGLVAFHQGDFAAARKFLEEGLAISRQLDDPAGIAPALNNLGDLTRTEGDDAAARPLIEESLAIYTKLGNKQGICANNVNLGNIAYIEGDFKKMRFRLTEALATAQELGEKIYISCCFDGFASLALKDKQLERAARLAGAAENLRESFGYEIEPAERRLRDAYLAELRTALDKAHFSEFYKQGRKLKLEESVALCLEETEKTAAPHTSESATSESDFFKPANVFEACRLARIYFEQTTIPTYIKTRELLEEAIRLDADYAPAYVALAELCIKEAIYNLSPLAVGFEGAKNALERAADLNANSAEFYAAKGFFALVADWDFDEASRNLHESLAINPQCAFANNYLGQVFMFRCKFDEAQNYMRRAVKIEPTSLSNHGMLVISHFLARDFQKSLELLGKYFALNPQSVAGEQILCWNLEQTGRAAEAVVIYEKHLDQPYGIYFKQCLGYAYATAGDKENARKIAAELVAESRKHYISPVHSATIYAALGETDEAVLHLENAFANRDPWMLWLAADPRFDNLRTDSRFQKLEKFVISERCLSLSEQN